MTTEKTCLSLSLTARPHADPEGNRKRVHTDYRG